MIVLHFKNTLIIFEEINILNDELIYCCIDLKNINLLA